MTFLFENVQLNVPENSGNVVKLEKKNLKKYIDKEINAINKKKKENILSYFFILYKFYIHFEVIIRTF